MTRFVASRVRRSFVVFTVVVLLLPLGAARAQEGGGTASSREAFVCEAVKKLIANNALVSQYTFTERDIRVDFDGGERPTKKTERTFEVYPQGDGHPSYRRHLTTNGVPVDPRKLEEADRKHREKVLRFVSERQKETEASRAKRERKEAEARQEEERTLEEIFCAWAVVPGRGGSSERRERRLIMGDSVNLLSGERAATPLIRRYRLASVDGPLANDTITYTYDELGRVVKRAINGVTTTQAYDALEWVTSETNVLGTFTHGYVGATGRLQLVTYPNGQTSSYAYFDASEAVYEVDQAGTGKTFTYDANGNMTSDGTRTFEWDARNQLVAVNVGAHRSEFTYDGRQRRVRELESEVGVIVSDSRFLQRASPTGFLTAERLRTAWSQSWKE